MKFIPLTQGSEIAETSAALVPNGFQEESSALLTQQMLMQNRLEDVNDHLSSEINHLGQVVQKLINTVRSFLNRPAVVVRSSTRAASQTQALSDPIVEINSNAKLSKRPKDLHELWNEYEFGLHGNKAAKLFTSRERGDKKIKFAYCRRKIFWTKVKSMIARGHSSGTAIQKIYEVFGQNLPVTAIINKLRADRDSHPQLN